MRYNNHVTSISLGRVIGQLAFVALVATGCGGGSGGNYVGDPPVTPTPTPTPAPPTPGISLLAGSIGGWGNIDGVGAAARFGYPSAVASDGIGNVYVADRNTIRKVTPSGIVTTLAGRSGVFGSTDGQGAAARFGQLGGVAVDAAGNVYAIETFSATVRRITAGGVVTTLAGTGYVLGSADGRGAAASFYSSQGIAVDAVGSVYVTDSGNHTVRKITAAGLVTTIAGTAGMYGNTDGFGTEARFSYPRSIAVDGSGNIFVGDQGGSNVIRKITLDGVVTTLPDAGASGLAADAMGNIYVAESRTHTVRKITPAGIKTTLAGDGSAGSADGVGTAARFSAPESVAVDASGNVYVADSNNATIRKISPVGSVTTLAGQAKATGSADGVGASATFSNTAVWQSGEYPNYGNFNDVAIDAAGNVYVADCASATIRKITPTGVVSTLAGATGERGAADGPGTVARFDSPIGVAVDAAGNVYVADAGNATLRRITSTGVVTTVAGLAGQRGSTDDIGAAARFNQPGGVAVDAAGNVYLTDQSFTVNSGSLFPTTVYANTIRKVTPPGVVTTLAGTAGTTGSVDGMGAAARFNLGGMTGVAVDVAGNVYVVDSGNHTIRKITSTGVVTTLAGNAGTRGTVDGIGTAASFDHPRRVAVDPSGNVYVTSGNVFVGRGNVETGSTIRKITPAGLVTTVAGQAKSEGIALGALPGSLAYLGGISVDAKGALYVASQAAVLKVQLPQ